jgi:hypothetical protein
MEVRCLLLVVQCLEGNHRSVNCDRESHHTQGLLDHTRQARFRQDHPRELKLPAQSQRQQLERWTRQEPLSCQGCRVESRRAHYPKMQVQQKRKMAIHRCSWVLGRWIP